MISQGTRIFAICDIDEDKKEVVCFGGGIYADEEETPPGVFMAGLEIRSDSPKLVLDSGDVVYGCECWWGPENNMLTLINGYHRTYISVTEYRRMAAIAAADKPEWSPDDENLEDGDGLATA